VANPQTKAGHMKLSDEKVIEFFWKSPVKSFSTMLDALRYLDGKWMPEEGEYELFDDALGDNPEEKIKIRVPHLRGVPANALLTFAWHAMSFNMIRRRARAMKEGFEPEDMIVFYELTPSGGYAVKVLEVLTDVSALAAVDMP
jgi:hypothetical protein